MNKLVENLEAIADLDAIGRTPLLTPLAFLHLCRDEVDRAQRYDRPLSVALVGIDGLTALRRDSGSAVAAAAFDAVAKIVLADLRRPDRAGRLSFAEVGILMPETPLRNAAKACERIAARVHHAALPVAPGTTLSVGVAGHSPRQRSVQTLLMTASLELSRARAAGGGRVAVAPGDVVTVSVPRSGQIH